MSDIFGDGEANAQGREQCRVAYTLNHTQPVSCTIIGSEPLFYMDYECDYEDEYFDEIEHGLLKKELLNLQEEIELFDRLNSAESESQEKKFQNILENAESFQSVRSKPVSDLDIVKIKNILRKSRLGEAYINYAEDRGIKIILDESIRGSSSDFKNRKIYIQSSLSYEDQILLSVRELRKHWQHNHLGSVEPFLFAPDHAVFINRLCIADAAVSVVRVAWELQLSGSKEVWERLESSPLSDLAYTFAREAFTDFRTLNNGEAAAAVFETWFLSERCKLEDKRLIQAMLAGYNYYVSISETAQKTVTSVLLNVLGEMPFGKNYLAHHVETILNDPIFWDVRDRSNANFLWFIKFERSFNEVERELQNGSVSTLVKGSPSSYQQKNQDQLYDRPGFSTNVAQIIPFEQYKDRQQTSSSHSRSHRRGADIIYLRRWSGE